MKEIISKEEFDELMKTEGEMRGFGLKNLKDFILREEGEKEFGRFKKIMVKLGCPIDFKNIKILDFYPFSWHTVAFVVTKRIFNYEDEKFQEMGRFAAQTPFIVRRYFMKSITSSSAETISKETEKIWRKVSTVGTLKVVEVDQNKKHLILRFEDFHCHPLLCQLLIGFFKGVSQMLVGTEASCEEKKCPNLGDEHHDFLIRLH